jgi:carbamoyltransferase
VQTVRREENPLYHELLSEFERQTGCAVLVNTSFNVRGEPIVCRPSEAYACFMRTEMDCLVMGSYLLLKSEQGESALAEDTSWQEEFQLD